MSAAKPDFPLLSRADLRLAVVALLVWLVSMMVATPGSAAPWGVHQVRITNVNDVSFVVTWTTDAASIGAVRYGDTTALELGSAPDDLNPTPTTTHYVNVSGLNSGTTYFFDVLAGGLTDDNGGAHYAVTTGPSVLGPPGISVFGQVFAHEAAAGLDNVIVYLQVVRASGNSQRVAARTSTGGYWGYNLGNLRTANYQARFDPVVGETIQITVEGGRYGTGSFTAPVPAENGLIGNVTLTPPPGVVTRVYLPLILR